ncbi:condensin subunit ScpA [Abditibacterium utsteinense]|uniref:Segregation and condensation protein A n=1 Tax=Abditibacterium utsteinense TaxID=1960156 RepID=A0A2S8SW41_9BACT|nr:segregation/condensation protein A [Abditibacterium utsteinense]PQV65013.1 condensin subunit ScpA [Abditibacterium utsteinense]
MSADSAPQTEPERFTGHKIRLPLFEGPLDLLLYLIRAHRADIFDIPIREITGQFVEYLALMREVDVEADYAGDFLVTAATLMQIKSRMLLPKTESQNEEIMEQDEADPRAELVERLLEYQRIREAAEELREKRDARADLFARPPESAKNQPDYDVELAEALLLSEISSFDLLSALRRVLKRVEERPVALVRRESFTLPDRLRGIAARLYHTGELSFETLCDDCQNRLEVVVTFLAILELIRRGRAKVRQLTLFDEIWLELS